jgi:hypothetical protein
VSWGVDEARLIAVDVDGLAAWDDRNSQDGKADVVFWGSNAADVAAEVGASPIDFAGEANLFGWANLTFDDARDRAERVRSLRSDERKFAVDFRPHTHHWQVMRNVRATRTESGVLDLAGARLCMFMTTWGDGAFPIEADLDPAGQVLRIRIEVGCDKTVARMRNLVRRVREARYRLGQSCPRRRASALVAVPANLLGQVEPAFAAQVEVKRDQCDGMALELRLRLLAVLGFRDAEPFPLQAPS